MTDQDWQPAKHPSAITTIRVVIDCAMISDGTLQGEAPMRSMTIIMRGGAAILGVAVTIVGGLIIGGLLFHYADTRFPPDIGNPSTDPHGRGIMGAAAVDHIGLLPLVLVAAIGGWLGWLLSSKKNWSLDLLVCAPSFLLFAGICLANYTELDTIFTRDAQAVLNLPFALSGAVVVILLQKSLIQSKHLVLTLSGSTVLAFSIYGFVAVPFWYSLSYFSWKLGSGELTSLDSAAKAISAAASLLAVIGLQWKNGRLSTEMPLSDRPS